MAAVVNIPLANSRLSRPAQSWLENRLRQLGKNSIAELTREQRVQLSNEASSESSKIYLLSIFTAAGVAALAVFLFPAIFILAALALMGTAAFAHDAVVVTGVVGFIAAIILSIKKGAENCPDLYNRYLIEPFEKARDLRNLNIV